MPSISRRGGLTVLAAILCLSLPLLWACAPAERADQGTSTDEEATLSPETDGTDAAENDIPAGPGAVDDGSSSMGAAGRMVFLDPETGKLTSKRPTTGKALEIPEKLLDTISTSHDEVTIATMPDGTLVATRPGGFRSALTATVDENGQIRLGHAAGAADAEEEEADDE